jgi:hypothetical protein
VNTTELRAAALYLIQPPDDANPYRGSVEMRRFVGKSLELADAVIAEHPADDEEPASDEWLQSIGFVVEESGTLSMPNVHNTLCIDHDMEFYIRGETSNCHDYTASLVVAKTKGQVRNLLRGLGYDIKG